MTSVCMAITGSHFSNNDCRDWALGVSRHGSIPKCHNTPPPTHPKLWNNYSRLLKITAQHILLCKAVAEYWWPGYVALFPNGCIIAANLTGSHTHKSHWHTRTHMHAHTQTRSRRHTHAHKHTNTGLVKRQDKCSLPRWRPKIFWGWPNAGLNLRSIMDIHAFAQSVDEQLFVICHTQSHTHQARRTWANIFNLDMNLNWCCDCPTESGKPPCFRQAGPEITLTLCTTIYQANYFY